MSYMKVLYEDIWECKTDLHMTDHEIAWHLNIPLDWVESAIASHQQQQEEEQHDQNQTDFYSQT